MPIQWEDEELCPVCHNGDTDEPVTLLPCAHKIHEPCLVDLAQAMQCSMDDLKCPVCKKTGNDIWRLERQLLSPDRSPPIVTFDSSDDELVPHSIEDDAFFEATLRAVDEASDASEGECVESESDFIPDPIVPMDVEEFMARRGFDPRLVDGLPVEAKSSGGTPTLVAEVPPPPKFNPVMAAFRRSAALSSDFIDSAIRSAEELDNGATLRCNEKMVSVPFSTLMLCKETTARSKEACKQALASMLSPINQLRVECGVLANSEAVLDQIIASVKNS